MRELTPPAKRRRIERSYSNSPSPDRTRGPRTEQSTRQSREYNSAGKQFSSQSVDKRRSASSELRNTPKSNKQRTDKRRRSRSAHSSDSSRSVTPCRSPSISVIRAGGKVSSDKKHNRERSGSQESQESRSRNRQSRSTKRDIRNKSADIKSSDRRTEQHKQHTPSPARRRRHSSSPETREDSSRRSHVRDKRSSSQTERSREKESSSNLKSHTDRPKQPEYLSSKAK
mgnify:FL=1